MKRYALLLLLVTCLAAPARADNCGGFSDCAMLVATGAAIIGGLILAGVVLYLAWPAIAGLLAEESGAVAINNGTVGLGAIIAGEGLAAHPELVEELTTLEEEITGELEGTVGAGTAEGEAASEETNQAVESAKSDPNKVDHIFDNPTSDHNWDVTGLDQNGNWDLIQETVEQNYGQLPDNGVFEVTQQFGLYSVTVRGAIVNGSIRIGTAWVNAL